MQVKCPISERKIKLGLAVVASVALLSAGTLSMSTSPAGAQTSELEQQFLSIGTSSVGGTWYPFGGALAATVTKSYPQLNITAEITGGSVDNLNLMANDQLELALSTSPEAYSAFHGESPFKEAIQNFGGVVTGHGQYWQLYTLKSAGVTSIADLKGKRVSLGAAGSVGNGIGQTVIEAHGLKMGVDWTPEYISHGQGPGALRDGQIDAALIVSSFPTSAVTDITSTEGEDVVFLNPEPDVLDRLIAERPYWSKATIPAGLYPGHPQAIPGSFGFYTILIAKKELSDDTVYAITKAILENNDELTATHSLGAEWTSDKALLGLKDVIPLHPGAAKYLKEKGLY